MNFRSTLAGFGRFLRRVFTLRRLAFTAASLATVIAGFYIVENWRGERAWAAAQARLRAAGEPLTLEEFLPTPPPDEQNFLMNPVFVRRFGFGKKGANSTEEPTGVDRVPERTGDYPPNYARAADGTPLEFPYDALGESGTPPDMAAIAPFLPEELRPPSDATEQEAANAILRWTNKWEPDFTTLAEAVRTRTTSHIPWTTPEEFHSKLSLLDGFTDMLNILQLQALAQVSAADSSGALESILILLRIGQAFESPPNWLIYYVIGEGAVARALAPLRHGLANGLWTASQLHQLEVALRRVDSRGGYRNAIRAERFYVGQVVEQLIAGNNKFLSKPDQARRPWSLAGWAPRGWWRQNEAHAVPWWIEQFDRWRFPAMTRPPSKLISAGIRTSPYTMLLPQIIRGMEGLGELADKQEAAIALSRTAIALEIHRLKEGRYPDTLVEATRLLGTEALLDPYAGKSPEYAMEQGRPKLWSVGPNQRDDGGNENAEGADDIVWAYPVR